MVAECGWFVWEQRTSVSVHSETWRSCLAWSWHCTLGPGYCKFLFHFHSFTKPENNQPRCWVFVYWILQKAIVTNWQCHLLIVACRYTDSGLHIYLIAVKLNFCFSKQVEQARLPVCLSNFNAALSRLYNGKYDYIKTVSHIALIILFPLRNTVVIQSQRHLVCENSCFSNLWKLVFPEPGLTWSIFGKKVGQLNKHRLLHVRKCMYSVHECACVEP